MEINDDRLLADIARRNWLILAGLVLLSLFWRLPGLTMGVAGGGFIAIGSFIWLKTSLAGLLLPSGRKTRSGFFLSSLIRFLVLAVVLYLLLGPGNAHPVGVAIGVSVIFLNLLWTAIFRLFQFRKQG